MTNIHPLIVHFPIALIIVIFILDFLGVLFKKKSFLSTANILTIFAALGALMAVVTGMIAEESVWHPGEAHEMLELHEAIGFIILGLMLVLLIFRPAVKKKLLGKLGWVAVFLSFAASLLVGYTGYLGGEIVYKYGTGVQQAEIETARADSLAKELSKLSDEGANSDLEEKSESDRHDSSDHKH